jgi:REP element-mobilizing transposase RayT
VAFLGYFITYHTYGTWLHGIDQGSVDLDHNVRGTPPLAEDRFRETRERRTLKHAPLELCAERRFVVDRTVREVCEYRRWQLHAINVRSTHVHVVVTASHAPERVMSDLKAYGTRRMREAEVLGLDTEAWSYHGSTRYLNTERSIARAVEYVLHEQGEGLEMRAPVGWLRGRGNPLADKKEKNPSLTLGARRCWRW